MVITFDFDDTLKLTKLLRDEDGDIAGIGYTDDQNPVVFPEFEAALDRGDEVHIVTSRMGSKKTKEKMQEWLRGKLIIRDEKGKVLTDRFKRLAGIHFTEGQLKHDTLARLGSRQHFDDDPEELAHLPEGCRGVRAPLHPSWTAPMNENHVRQWVITLLS
jgi:hypothetical protein